MNDSGKKHATLSASGSKRWLTCTPSAQLEQRFENTTSSYAEEGTFAHALGELKIGRQIANTVKPSVYKTTLAQMQKHPLYSKEMEDCVDQYVQIVWERFMQAKNACPDASILLEQRLDFSPWVPDGFGTGDVLIIADQTIEVIDYKHGKGVPVSAENNTQMQLYALGAINQFGFLYDIQTVRMTIVQPRIDNFSISEMEVEHLLDKAELYIKPRAQMAIAGEGDFVSGEHCRFCRAKATCRARAEENLHLAKYDFQDPFLLTDVEIGEVLLQVEELTKWAKDIQEYAQDQAINHGYKWPGWKVVEGRSNRKYVDEVEVAGVLMEAGYEEDKIFGPRPLHGITAMEKVIGKKKFEELLNGLVIKPAGAPTLVPETDKRPELNSAAAAADDFKN